MDSILEQEKEEEWEERWGEGLLVYLSKQI